MRIVSLCPSLTELIFALGKGEELVGVTKFCIHPAEGVAKIEKVGGTKDPDVARVIDLEPDLVLLNEEENRREDAEALRSAGLKLHTSLPRDIPGTAATIRSIGSALGAHAAAEGLAREIEALARSLRLKHQHRPALPFAYLIWRHPWMSVNAGTYASKLLELPGGVNVFGERAERYPEITPEDLRQADPSLVCLSSEPFPFEAKHQDELARLTGLPRERFVLCDGELLSWHGPRTKRGMEYAEGWIEAARRRAQR